MIMIKLQKCFLSKVKESMLNLETLEMIIQLFGF